ncbi:MAG: VWA-like domain-containing protein [Flavobacteriia bacterium]|nr:VWA-like domain-containing protein [Flavobacteriia bacterium]
MSKQETLSKTAKDLMLKEPYYGHFLIMLNKYWSTRVPTAGVSKMNINYQLEINENFWAKLTDNYRLGLLKHELLHIAFGHLTSIFKFTDRKLANIAMDMEINQYIQKGWLPGDEYTKDEFDEIVKSVKERIAAGKEDGSLTEEQMKEIASEIPDRGIMIEDYPELNLDTKAGSRYYYDKLQEAKEKKKQDGTCGSPGMDELLDQLENGEGLPDHSTWDDFENMSEAEQKLIEKQLQKLLSDAKEQTVKKRGTVPGEIEGLIEIDEILPPKFDWRGYIRRFTGISTRVFTKKIRRKENRKFPDNPGLKLKMKQHMLLAIDTSGSVSEGELAEFMNEMHHIYKAGVDITVIQCDTKIHSIEPYKGELDLKVHGRGGTEFDPVIEYFNDHNKLYTSLVYFTDGECSASVLPKGPTLWVISEQSSMNENLPGKVIKLEL